MATRPLALLGASVLEATRRTLTAVLATWSEEWGLDAVPLVCRRAWEEPAIHSAAWRRRYQEAGMLICAAWDAGFEDALQTRMFGMTHTDAPRQSTPIAAASASAGAQAAADRIAAMLFASCSAVSVAAGSDVCAEVNAAWRPFSGAVLVSFLLDGYPMQCLLNHASVRALVAREGSAMATVPGLPALDAIPRPEALLRNTVMPLRIEAGQATVALASLATLQPGDVIPLQQHVDAPLPVHGPDGTILFAAHLGAASGKLAIELTRSPLSEAGPGPYRSFHS
jgi:hypothetical protein